MTSRDFAYWLQGFFEISENNMVTEHQVSIIKNHLNMVFKHEIDPSHGDKDHQKMLSDIHKRIDTGGTQGVHPTGGMLVNC